MKLWILLAVAAVCFVGCQSTEGLQAISPVRNEVQFTGDYLPADQVDSPPTVSEQTPPEFPSVMAKARIDGKAIIALIVTATGKPEQVQVEQATHPLFAASALAAVKRWRFKPAMKDGHPVASTLSLPLEFRRDTSADFVPAE